MVYPGDEGPIDSIRWELFAEGLQDFAILQSAGIRTGAAVLRRLKSFTEYPRNGAWYRGARRKILSAAPGAKQTNQEAHL